MKPGSLFARLALFIALLLCGGWITAATAGWLEASEYINEFYDTRQALFARHLAAFQYESNVSSQPVKPPAFSVISAYGKGGELEDEALSFAVFDRRGQLLLHDGEEGKNFIYSGQAQGFIESKIAGSDDPWRVLWVDSPDGRLRIVVGQELEYRQDMVWDLLEKQFMPWLIIFPLLLLGALFIIYRQLRPLRELTARLNRRSPQSCEPLHLTNLPSEARPMLNALNNLFARTSSLLERERAFISDAAHELKTPLTALRIQAEVAGLDGVDEAARKNALNKLELGIERCAHLVEQLLALSRLEAMAHGAQSRACNLENAAELDLPDLLAEAVSEVYPALDKKNIELHTDISSSSKAAAPQGQAALIALMLRNLLENAVKYTPDNGKIEIFLTAHALQICNSGPGVASEYLPRLGERFFRPPGQTETGSGLGLSIVRRIAELHGFKTEFRNLCSPGSAYNTGFCAAIHFQT
ncbi:MAG: two-component system sensor histidine kinase QseC [Desulfovibrionaceae bacterium]|nr:two-component system sensor histidine kinase QseC [Desulfovibrionaceae bacterium]